MVGGLSQSHGMFGRLILSLIFYALDTYGSMAFYVYITVVDSSSCQSRVGIYIIYPMILHVCILISQPTPTDRMYLQLFKIAIMSEEEGLTLVLP
ncbi:hypothetical protein DFP73DRAFT_51292 [Morchella snyderi]|nr:hypothetical protein DFP73DRAFT_51292 [Morchella snyderi]